MINKDRIVPVMKSDLLTLYGTMLGIAGTSYSVIASKDVEGTFEVTGSGDAGNKLADQPVKSLDLKSGVTAAVVYFVAAYDFEKILVAGAAPTFGSGSKDIIPDASTLHKATLSSGEVTITYVSPVAS